MGLGEVGWCGGPGLREGQAVGILQLHQQSLDRLPKGKAGLAKEGTSPTAAPANPDAQAACYYLQVGTFASSGHTGFLERLAVQRWNAGAPALHTCDSYTSRFEKE